MALRVQELDRPQNDHERSTTDQSAGGKGNQHQGSKSERRSTMDLYQIRL
jgi:hypothetical protein